jgi:uncharacterized lipoprotein YddW (UPF0748 family)
VGGAVTIVLDVKVLWQSALLFAAGLNTACIEPARSVGGAIERSVWVSRFEYRTGSDIDLIMRRCREAGFRTVMFQVRANGTAYFGTRKEPWSETYDFRAPDVDPLAHAVNAARANGLKLQAWVNVLPGWRGDVAPTDPRQLFHSRPEWFLRNFEGELVTEGSYSFLNPCLPDVRTYLAELCEEVARFGVDAIHLDYIRFPAGAASERSPGDPASLARFGRETGRDPSDIVAFRAWKAACVTDLVRQVRERLNRLGRPVPLTVAVNPDLEKIRRDVLQDWPTWARRGMVDAIFPMNYTSDPVEFARRSSTCVDVARGVPVVMGIGVYKHQEAALGAGSTVRQMDAALRSGAAGVGLFSYGSALSAEWGPAVASWNVRHTRGLGR